MQSQHQEMVQTMCKHPEVQDGFFYPQWLVVRVVSKRELQHLYLRAIGEQSHVPLLHVIKGIIRRPNDGKSKEDERTGEPCSQHLNGYSIKINISLQGRHICSK